MKYRSKPFAEGFGRLFWRDFVQVNQEEKMKTLTLIQELFFDMSDLANGQTYKSLGYENKQEFYSECKSKLERIEQDWIQVNQEAELCK